MTPQQTFNAIKSETDGPAKKFKLIKLFRAALRQNGSVDPKSLSCAELEKQIEDIILDVR